MRLLTKITLACLAVVGVSAQAQAARYLYQYVPSCSYCDYQTPFSFTFDTLVPQVNLGFEVYKYLGVDTAFLNHGGFSVESPNEFNPDSGLTFDTLGLDIIESYLRLSYPDGDYFFEAFVSTQPLFYLASDGSLNPLFVETNRDPSVIALHDRGGQNLGSFKVSEIDDAPSPTPEPSTWAMMLVGFGAMGWSMRQRKISSSFG